MVATLCVPTPVGMLCICGTERQHDKAQRRCHHPLGFAARANRPIIAIANGCIAKRKACSSATLSFSKA
jgi:hypothetical protein